MSALFFDIDGTILSETTHEMCIRDRYLSVGLLNTSYREEYCLWVNSENVVVGTWRPNVTYLPAEEDMTWKFTGTFEPSCIL